MSQCLFVIIDPQNDFVSKEGAYAKRHTGIAQIQEACKNIEDLLPRLHKEEVLIVYSNYQENQFDKSLSICIPGTFGHGIGLQLNSEYTQVPKSDHSCFSAPTFKELLMERKIETLILCGFLAEYCVYETALDGLTNGYAVTVLSNCTGTADDKQQQQFEAFNILQSKGAIIQ